MDVFGRRINLRGLLDPNFRAFFKNTKLVNKKMPIDELANTRKNRIRPGSVHGSDDDDDDIGLAI